MPSKKKSSKKKISSTSKKSMKQLVVNPLYKLYINTNDKSISSFIPKYKITDNKGSESVVFSFKDRSINCK
jgi:hypothetical protein